MKLPFFDGYRLILKAFEEVEKAKAWDIYLIHRKRMNKDNFMTFEEFINEANQVSKTSTKSKEDILSKAEQIRQADKKRHSKGV